MKKLLLFIMLTAILSCSIFKNKTKEKKFLKTDDKLNLTVKSNEKDKGVEIITKSDSAALKSHSTANKFFLLTHRILICKIMANVQILEQLDL
ncbi:hypothetical protein SAMN05421847_2202 [Halpernia humi]|uniref:Lipoprotein n=1 Tax=Halpernia humi TaxID=493375 RepID=A0A1H5ZUT8_9FLAO|nr:hypothetical protein [Halpernia humi]SEG39744.1 hypothetical protein SAMN05421847_2202 [Halpernia humi]